jgi:hypothetical protein
MEQGSGPLSPAGQIDIRAGLDKYVSDIIVATGLQDKIIYWNKAAEKFYGVPGGRSWDGPLGRWSGMNFPGSRKTK